MKDPAGHPKEFTLHLQGQREVCSGTRHDTITFRFDTGRGPLRFCICIPLGLTLSGERVGRRESAGSGGAATIRRGRAGFHVDRPAWRGGPERKTPRRGAASPGSQAGRSDWRLLSPSRSEAPPQPAYPGNHLDFGLHSTDTRLFRLRLARPGLCTRLGGATQIVPNALLCGSGINHTLQSTFALLINLS